MEWTNCNSASAGTTRSLSARVTQCMSTRSPRRSDARHCPMAGMTARTVACGTLARRGWRARTLRQWSSRRRSWTDWARRSAIPPGRRMAAEANHQSEELLRLLLDGACDCAVHVLDTAGHIVGWSKGAELLTGYHAEEVMAQHHGFLFRREDRAEDFPGWQLHRALVHGRIEEEGRLLGKDGAAFWPPWAMSCALRSHP